MTVRGGYYLGGNADIRANAAVIGGVRALTQYRSLADPYLLPGWKGEWLTQLDDVLINCVVELKFYGTRLGPQTVNGCTVPAPSMMIQRRDGTGVPAYGYGQVLAGHLDPLLDRLRAQLLTMPHPELLNIQWASEFDTDHESGIVENGQRIGWEEADARAVTAVTYMTSYLLDAGLPAGVTFSLGCGGFDRTSFRRLHPASLAGRVDRMQFNAYNHGSTRSAYEVLNRTRTWIRTDLDPRWHRKPIIIAEYGTAASLGSQAAWLAGVSGAVDRMESDGRPFVEALVYFDSNPEWSTLQPRPEGLQALNSAYSKAPLARAPRPVTCARTR